MENQPIKAAKYGRNSIAHTLLFALFIALGFGALVSAISVLLQPTQAQNRSADQQFLLDQLLQNLPELQDPSDGPLQTVEKVVALDRGCYVPGTAFGQNPAVGSSDATQPLRKEDDLAQISTRPEHVVVHLTRRRGVVKVITLPVYGLGYASQLHGYLTLDANDKRVLALVFYDHGETPGMGGRISASGWSEQWHNKRLSDATGNLRIGVATTVPTPPEDQPYQIDAMSGATVTAKGITNLLRFWAGPLGFGPYLENLHTNARCIR